MSNRLGPIAALLISVVAGSRLSAQVVYDNGGPWAPQSDFSASTIYDDFTLGYATHVTTIEYFVDWVRELYPPLFTTGYAGSTLWYIYDDASGTRGNLRFSGSTAGTFQNSAGADNSGECGGGPIAGSHCVQHDLSVSFTLSAGTYWLGLSNGVPTEPNNAGYFWVGSRTGGGSLGSAGFEQAFSIAGTAITPEPSSIALLAVGLAGMAGLARKRK